MSSNEPFEIFINGESVKSFKSRVVAIGYAIRKKDNHHSVAVVLYTKGRGYKTIARWEFGKKVQ